LSDEVDTGDLLQTLDEAGKDCAVSMTCFTFAVEDGTEATSTHLNDGILDSEELLVHDGILWSAVVECGEDSQSLLGTTVQDEPARTLGKEEENTSDEQHHGDLEGNGYTPCSR